MYSHLSTAEPGQWRDKKLVKVTGLTPERVQFFSVHQIHQGDLSVVFSSYKDLKMWFE
jgi:hypothetical protein